VALELSFHLCYRMLLFVTTYQTDHQKKHIIIINYPCWKHYSRDTIICMYNHNYVYIYNHIIYIIILNIYIYPPKVVMFAISHTVRSSAGGPSRPEPPRIDVSQPQVFSQVPQGLVAGYP
jgi:hypothetical protein